MSTWVGFVGDVVAVEGERRASTNWPIQKYQWTDYMAEPGDRLQYRVLAMVGADKANLRPDPANSSEWTAEIVLSHQVEPSAAVYFNRGIVASQWVSRRLGISDRGLRNAELAKVIGTPGNPFRDYLAGPLGARLFALLDEAAAKKLHVYAALYELDDPQLVGALVQLGDHAHVVLANGSVKKKGEDQNSAARGELLRAGADLHDRMCAPRALGHNKFLVVCDSRRRPHRVWTGSQNWTDTGLCTQANNSVLLDDRKLAAEYRRQWDLLRDAKEKTPDTLRAANSMARSSAKNRRPVTLWFTPTKDQADLVDARSVVAGAQQAVLFLMFNPGPRDSLLNAIIAAARSDAAGGRRLYIKGVVNQDPSTAKNPVQLFDHANRVSADFDVALPAAIDVPTEFFAREMKKLNGTFAMVHSKVIVVDPFGTEPAVITGSHNLGPKASRTNDENMLIMRRSSALAAAYATNIMSVYNQYRWRFRRQAQPPARRWAGLEDGDGWQRGYLREGSAALREIDFWVGE